MAGFGAVVSRGDALGEIKRMYVDPGARGQGVGRAILLRLEDHAHHLGLVRLRLETGIKQAAATGLYRSSGYREIGPFAPYGPDLLSLFFEKRLAS
jgi:putative acetyltransferase